MYILIGCEESQAICLAFRALGFEAYSCDLKVCSGGHPEWHLKMDVFKAIQGGKLKLQNGDDIFIDKWMYAMFHPECTYVANSSTQWLSHPDDKKLKFIKRREHPLYIGRREKMWNTIDFVKKLYSCKIELLDIENPVGILSSQWKKPNQIIEPWMFGDEATKGTCIWSKGLPLLKATKIVGKGKRIVFDSGKSHPEWYANARGLNKYERQELRSKTFPGIAQAIANQRGNFILNYQKPKTLFDLGI